VSNELVAGWASVRLTTGTLLVVQPFATAEPTHGGAR
jgi:hypothetical protein